MRGRGGAEHPFDDCIGFVRVIKDKGGMATKEQTALE